MATRKNVSPAIVCAENIVLLSMLDETPNPPHANCIVVAESRKKKKTAQRILSPEKESALVRRISFLAAVTDDPNHIVAACLEELPTGDGMRVMLAINKGEAGSSSKALNRIQCGLENIFQLLCRTNASSSDPGGYDYAAAEHLHTLLTVFIQGARLCSMPTSLKPSSKCARTGFSLASDTKQAKQPARSHLSPAC